MSKKYTLKDAVETFWNNENFNSIEAIVNERDISDTILQIDMRDGDILFLEFEHFRTLFQDLNFYEINIIDEDEVYGFEFWANKSEYYKLLYNK